MATHKMKLFLAAILVTSLYVDMAQSQTCRGDAGVAIARAYAIASSYPDSVPEFVGKNRALFQQNGDAIRCGSLLASQLRSAALQGPSPNSIREQASNMADQAGRPDLGPVVADDMLKSRLDMLELASDIQDLVDTLPSIIDGDVTPYQNSNVYQKPKFVIGILENSGLLTPRDLHDWRDLTMKICEWYVRQFVSLVP